MKRISLIIPTYNEAPNVEPLVQEIIETVDSSLADIEFIFVDDNSPDGTADAINRMAGKYPVRVIRRAGKLGLGSAVIEGFKASDREYMGVMDADLSHDPIILNDMIQALDECDIVIGSRFNSGSEVEGWVWWRELTSKAGVLLTRALSGSNDPLSGYFILKRSVIDSVQLKTTGYKILFEILVKGNWEKLKEFSYTFRMRKYSTSKLSTREYYLFAKQIIVYTWYKATHLKK